MLDEVEEEVDAGDPTLAEVLDDPDKVDDILDELTEHKVVQLGIKAIFNLLNAKLKEFENEKFGEFSYNRQSDSSDYAALKAEILSYRDGALNDISAADLLAKTKAITKKIDNMHLTFDNNLDDEVGEDIAPQDIASHETELDQAEPSTEPVSTEPIVVPENTQFPPVEDDLLT